MSRFSFQLASDVSLRDGLGLELIDGESSNVVAEVFRSDADKTLTFRCFVDENLPLSLVEQMLETARRELEPFEDGTSLSAARNELRLPEPKFRGLF